MSNFNCSEFRVAVTSLLLSQGRRTGTALAVILTIFSYQAARGQEARESFKNPPEISSKNGVLQTKLTAEVNTIDLIGKRARLWLYDRQYTPPTLRVNPGDTINLTLNNKLNIGLLGNIPPTNLHYHGLNVSLGTNRDQYNYPVSPFGDYVFADFPNPLTQIQYSFQIPSNQRQGLYWYHPHSMPMGVIPCAPSPCPCPSASCPRNQSSMTTEFETMNGMSGALIVGDLLKQFPQLSNAKPRIRERVILLKDIQLINDPNNNQQFIVPFPMNSNSGTTRTLNGLFSPTLTIAPGEIQFWRIGNVGPDIYYNLQIVDPNNNPVPLYVIAQDGNGLRAPLLDSQTNSIPTRYVLPPGARVEFLVQVRSPGIYQFKTLYYSTGSAGDQYPEVGLATMVAQGHRINHPDLSKHYTKLEGFDTTLRDLCKWSNETHDCTAPVSTSRSINFSEDSGGNNFCINGKQFDPMNFNVKQDQDVTVDVGSDTVEEWDIYNCSNEQHVFHIHQVDFQVVSVNGKPAPFVGYQDTVNLPQADLNGNADSSKCQTCPANPQPPKVPVKPSVVRIRIPFSENKLLQNNDKFVFHCHIMNHEDNGMLAVVKINKLVGTKGTQKATSTKSGHKRK
jgi:suppressor of ftsI